MTRPLVYATAETLGQAWRLMPGGVVIENLVADAIVAGHIRFADGYGCVTGEGWKATVCRSEPRTRTRRHPRPWLVTEITSNQQPEDPK